MPANSRALLSSRARRSKNKCMCECLRAPSGRAAQGLGHGGIKISVCANAREPQEAKHLGAWARRKKCEERRIIRMKVEKFFENERKEFWLEQIKKCDWGAGTFLYRLLSEGSFHEAVGEKSEVLLLTEGDTLISFCTYAEKDDIQPTTLTPWVGFVYTFPQYRGNRYVGALFEEIEKIAKKDKIEKIYISTNHVGLYEKYGCEYYDTLKDMDGEPSRVYVKHVG